jgi:hypothetical protein
MKSVFAVSILCLACGAPAETKYSGIYVHGTKTGYTYSEDREDRYQGQSAIRSDSRWCNTVAMIGTKMKTVVDSTSWSSLDNRPLREVVKSDSNGHKFSVDAVYGAKTVEVDFEAEGKKVHKSVPLPDGLLFADSARAFHDQVANPGQKVTYFSFDAWSLKFTKLELVNVGPATYSDGGKEFPANLFEQRAEEGKIRIFTNSAGERVRIEYPMGMVTRSESKEVALAPNGPELPDIGMLAALKADTTISYPEHLTELKLRFSGEDLSRLPSDEGQAVTKEGESWIVDIHPPRIKDSVSKTIEEVQAGNERWIRPSDFLPSNDPKLRELAQKLVRKEKDVLGSAFAIMGHVNKLMRGDVGIGVPRDAVQILKERRGKCTDYAILTTTLLRAAGIPARVASGLITGDGTFYYHAWSEAWDGARWIAIDSVTNLQQLPACYVKLCQGDIEEGFRTPLLNPEKVKIQIVGLRR